MMASSPEVRLIVNADDFGLTTGVNRAVVELAEAGALTSATLMSSGAAFDDAVRRARPQSALNVGCHVVLVDGRPASAAGIATLRGESGSLHASLAHFVLELQSGRIVEAELEREVEAQIRRLQCAGLHVTHVDTHKHTHLFPRVARPLLRAAARCGVRAIRNPFEPEWSARLTRGALIRTLEVRALRGFQSTFKALCREYGVRTTDGSLGVSATGRLDRLALLQLLRDAPPGNWELVCHPGYHDAALDAVTTRLRQSREIEREVLLHLIPEAVQSRRIQLMSFAGL